MTQLSSVKIVSKYRKMVDPMMILKPIGTSRETRSLSIVVNAHECMLGGPSTISSDDGWEYKSFFIDGMLYIIIHRSTKQTSPLPKISCACGSSGKWYRINEEKYRFKYTQLVEKFKGLETGDTAVQFEESSSRVSARYSTRTTTRYSAATVLRPSSTKDQLIKSATIPTSDSEAENYFAK